MSDYSIEIAIERIVDVRTRRYFEEVHGSYALGHYRSAVVMLWSVVVTDILFKLDQLANAYSDSTAQTILSEIGTIRTGNPRSPEWEAELVNKVVSRTDLIDHAEFTHLQALQVHRHLSAHPVLTNADALFSPNKETTRAHIRNALDAVLTKPPIMSRKIFDAFIQDVEQISRLNPGEDGLRNFPEAKYFKHFSPATFAQVFKSLWRVVFKSADARCEANRCVNAQVVSVLLDYRRQLITDLISADRDWLSDVSFADGPMRELTNFFRRHPLTFPLFSDALKEPVRRYSALSLDHYALCWFVSDTPESHLDSMRNRIIAGETVRGDIFRLLRDSLITTASYDRVLSIGIEIYGQSGSYDSADSRFESMIRPYLDCYSHDQIIELLTRIESNGETSSRRRAWVDHREVKAVIDSRYPTIALTDFPRFSQSIA